MKKGVELKGLLDCFSVYASSHVSHLQIRPTRPCIDSVGSRRNACPPAFADDTGVAHRSGRSKWRLMPSPRSYLTASSAEMARVPLQCRHTVA